jgi:16S rRNA (cytosine1402-N4)-methyltransferase
MPLHEPVMTAEVLHHLQPQSGGVFVDCTVGLGGHARALLEAGASHVIGLDRDTDALTHARTTLAPYLDRVELVHADFRTLPEILDARGIAVVDGTLADLGVSSLQLDAEGRGFSFQRDEPLDMRMDRTTGETAADFVARADERELADVIYAYGEERFSRRVARRIVEARAEAPIVTTGRLAEIVRRAVPRRGPSRIDSATRTFQALRIRVNRELEGLEQFIQSTANRLRAGARFVVITFHSLEDRIVKHTFRALAGIEKRISKYATAHTPAHPDAVSRAEAGAGPAGILRILTKKPTTASEDELLRNPRARSAKLRAAERIA